MNNTVLAVIAASLLGSTSYAADLPQKAPQAPVARVENGWAGLYAGVDAGAGWFTTTRTIDQDPNLNTKINGSGAFAGGFVGYNWQPFKDLVVGVESDLQWSDIGGTSTLDLGDGIQGTLKHRVDWFGTARGRVGYLPTSNLMLYGTGGLAYGGIETSTNIHEGNNGVTLLSGADVATKVGWTIGGGVEYKILPQWFVRAEYDYVDLGKVSHTLADITLTDKASWHQVRAGLAYRF